MWCIIDLRDLSSAILCYLYGTEIRCIGSGLLNHGIPWSKTSPSLIFLWRDYIPSSATSGGWPVKRIQSVLPPFPWHLRKSWARERVDWGRLHPRDRWLRIVWRVWWLGIWFQRRGWGEGGLCRERRGISSGEPREQNICWFRLWREEDIWDLAGLLWGM